MLAIRCEEWPILDYRVLIVLLGTFNVFLNAVFQELEYLVTLQVVSDEKQALNLVIAIGFEVLQHFVQDSLLIEFIGKHLDKAITVEYVDRRIASN